MVSKLYNVTVNFLAESDGSGDDNTGWNENGFKREIGDQVDDSKTETNGEGRKFHAQQLLFKAFFLI